MDQLSNIDAIISIIQKADDEKQKLKFIKYYLEGEVPIDSKTGKDLLQRRALFATRLREEGLWLD